jgi:hypothetical protein
MSTIARRLKRPSPALVVAFVALLVALGGVTYAAIPAPDGTIHACVGSRGALRAIDSAASCDPSEQALNFSQTGPPGQQGVTGPAGPAGQSQLLNFVHDISIKVPRKAGMPIGSFDLPEGKWAITFTGGVDIPSSSPVGLRLARSQKARAAAMVDFRTARAFSWGGDVSCKLALGDGSVKQTVGNSALIGLLIPAVQKQHGSGGGGGTGRSQHAAVNLQLVQDVPAGGGHGALTCVQANGKAGFTSPAAVMNNVSIIAVRVGDIGQLNFTPGR